MYAPASSSRFAPAVMELLPSKTKEPPSGASRIFELALITAPGSTLISLLLFCTESEDAEILPIKPDGPKLEVTVIAFGAAPGRTPALSVPSMTPPESES